MGGPGVGAGAAGVVAGIEGVWDALLMLSSKYSLTSSSVPPLYQKIHSFGLDKDAVSLKVFDHTLFLIHFSRYGHVPK